MKIYLDVCCFNRLYDDQSYLTTKLESEAKLFVQNEIKQGTFELVWSFMMDYENNANPYEERKIAIAEWKSIAVNYIQPHIEIRDAGTQLMSAGLKRKDALHMACAIHGQCEYFLTTDKGILNKKIDGIEILNPIAFIAKMEA
jgi:predicted nucleic acid-binding protein